MESLTIFVSFLLIYNTALCEPCQKEERCRCVQREDHKIDVDCGNAKLDVVEVCNLCNEISDITSLDVSENDLVNLPGACFSSCHDLVKLNIKSNKLRMINKDAFKGLLQLKILNLNNNSLIINGNISGSDSFESLKKLEVLHLQNNANVTSHMDSLFYLPNIASTAFPLLQTLYLDGQANTSFPSNFQNYKRLESVDFSRDSRICNIIHLTNKTFQHLSAIKRLNLSNCNISYIDIGTFASLKELQFLNLSYNMALGLRPLRNVSYGLQFTKTQVLDYSKVYKTFGTSTQLRSCDLWFLRNTQLKQIYFNSNRISIIETNAFALLPSTLEVVWAEDNVLSYGPFASQMGCLENLKRIELSRQQLVHTLTLYNDELHIQEKDVVPYTKCEVPRNLSKPNCPFLDNKPLSIRTVSFPSNLEILTFRQSNLRFQHTTLEFPLPIKNNIMSMDLSNNVMYNWSGSFLYLTKMKYLDLSDNFCADITTDFFKNAPNLESLQASNNRIGHRLASDINGKLFEPLSNIRKMNLSNNWIDHLPDNIFINIPSLEVLDLSFNQLRNVTFIPVTMTKIVELYLKQNKISMLPLKLLKQIEYNSKESGKSVSIDLSDNEISINCDNIDFLTWMMEHKNLFRNIQSYTFRKDIGATLSYKYMAATLSSLQKGCQNYAAVIVVSVALITAFFALVIGGICYRYRWRLRYLYYMAKGRYLGYFPVRDGPEQHLYPYDAFISYSHDDYVFVKDQIVPQLEEEAGLSLCIHQRDFIPGHYIAENILQAIKDSRITIILLSPSFLESQWCVYEFNMARMESIYSRGGENNLFVIMYKDIDMSTISHEMRFCLESESFLKFPNEDAELLYFWHMLKDALGGTRL